MHFFQSALLAASALTAFAFAAPQATTTAPTDSGNVGLPNPISYPTAGTKLKAGDPITITWKPSDTKEIDLVLRKGDSNNLETVEVIVEGTENDGTYIWTPSKDLEGSDQYAIEIISDGVSNYSPQFEIDSNGKGLSITTTTKETTTTTTTATYSTTTTTAPNNKNSTTTSTTTTTNITTRRPTTTSTPNAETDAPNPNDAPGVLSSPLALILCVGAAVAYLS